MIWRSKAWLGALLAWLLIAGTAFAQRLLGRDGCGRQRPGAFYFFWSETCPHCLRRTRSWRRFPIERPW
ncbi:MAG: hypothetical protein U1F59_03440 [Candidatus Competibacteraceae bacterium]